MSKSIIMFTLLAGLGVSTLASAWSSAPPAAQTQTSVASQKAGNPVIKPGDRNCLRHTGSLIHAKKGECLPVTGRSYSGDEMRRTGTQNNARALQMLDPSISVGH